MSIYYIAKSTFESQLSLIAGQVESISSGLANAYPLIANRSGKLLTTGVGKSGFVAERLAASLCSVGQVSVFMHPLNALHGDLGVVQEGDVLIVFSNSGTTAELADLLLYAKSHGVKVITFTGREDSPIARLSDAVVLAAFDEEGSLFNGPPMVSITAASMFSDALVNVVIEQTQFNEAGFARYHPAGQLGRNLLLKVKDVMLKVEDLPLFDQSSTLRHVMLELTASSVGVALFVGSAGKLEGILTDGDIRRILGEADFAMMDDPAYPLINTSSVTVLQDATVGEVLTLMENRERPLNLVVVLDSQFTVRGLVRVHDALK